MDQHAGVCAANNVDWYTSILRTHGHCGTIVNGIWQFHGKPPPYYSNAVTLSPDGLDAQYETLRDLTRALDGPFSVKDSFGVLELSSLGFRPLFNAEWIWREPTDGPESSGAAAGWQRVTSPAALEEWEAAWRENGSPADSRVFLPEVLTDSSIALYAARVDGRIVAGCAGNRSPGVVGFSNFFAAPGHDALMASAVAATAGFAPGLPVVGYERGEALAHARRLGFRAVGPLRVWIADRTS